MLCLARKDHYLIFEQGVSITQRHTHAHIHAGASSAMGIHRGPGISWGRSAKPCLNQQRRPSGDGSGVRETGRGEREERGERPKDAPLLFFQTFPGGTFYIWPRSPPSSPPTPLFLPTTLSRSDFWRPEYICLARAASTSHQPGTNALPWEQKTTEGGEAGGRGWQRTEPGALQGGGPRALVVEWI